MRKAWRALLEWLEPQTWLPGRDNSFGQQLLSSGALDLGVAEQPPHGWFRRLGFHCRMLWRRFVAELKADWPLLKPRLWVIIPCLVFQYIHAIFTGMAYYMHEPLPEPDTTLHDLGFEALPYLDVDAVSEVLVYCGFAQFFLWLLSPFVTRRKTFSASVVLKRVLVVLVSCQVLRILSFLSTQLPAPAPHCRAPEPTSNVLWPVWWRVIIVNVGRQASKGCGDLIFSSHLTFLLTFAWFYCYMGRYLAFKLYAFAYAAATALCIIASRKHYTVDVTVACYVVPLVAFHFFRTWTYRRYDIATADNRRLVSLLPHPAPRVAAALTGGAAAAANGAGSLGSSRKATDSWQGQAHEVAPAARLHGGEDVDVEMAARPGSAPVLSTGASDPGSPMQQAWSAIADLPRRMGSRTAPAHRRTDSQEPVLGYEDHSASTSAV